MYTQRKLARVWIAALLLTFSFTFPVLGAEDCTDTTNKVIEKLPFEIKGNTCIPDPGDNVINLISYADQTSKSCFLAGVKYPARDIVYKLKLHKGNEVSFLLTPLSQNGTEEPDAKTPDLVLAVIADCDNGLSCMSSSADFFGPEKEEISAAKYNEGVYYLVIDSAIDPGKDGSCGNYRLKVTGVNPTPDLSLEIKADRKRVRAGDPLTYTLTLTNSGDGPAIGVNLTQTLPPGVIFKKSDKCGWNGSKVECKDISVPERGEPDEPGKPGEPGEPGVWTADVKVTVSPDLQDKITTSAKAQIDDSTSAQDELTTVIDEVSDLSIHMSASPSEVIAGKVRIYTFDVSNTGPSNATKVEVTDTLDEDETFAGPTDHCQKADDRHVICTIPDEIATHGTASLSFPVTVKPSATFLSNKAAVATLMGSDPKPRNNEDHLDDIPVGRETDLFIGSVAASRLDREQAGPIPAGVPFAYAIDVRNAGPSDSSGGTVTLSLPEYLSFRDSASGCAHVTDPEDGSLHITCETPPIAAGDGKTVRFSLEASSALGMKNFHRAAAVAARETDPLDNNSTGFDTEIVIEADLQFEGDLEATEVVCGGDILYTMMVRNHGPSNSPGGTVTDVLEDLSFVESSDGCTVGSDKKTVTCPVGELTVDDPPVEIQFRALPITTGIVKNKASVQGEHDPSSSTSDSVSTTVYPSSDLDIALSASEDPLKPDQPFTYRVEVTNHGPSKADDVKVEVTLPPGLLPPSEPDPDCAICEFPQCTLDLRNIKVRDKGSATICAFAPAETGALPATATVAARSCDSNSVMNNTVELTTTVAEDSDADLALTMTADKEAVSADDLLTFSLRVVNQGFSKAEDVTTEVTLPDGLAFEPGGVCVTKTDDPQTVLCPSPAADPLELGPKAEWTTSFAARVSTDGRMLKTTAEVSSMQSDPNTTNNEPEVFTQRVAPLVVPFVEVDADAAHPTTIFRLKNPSEADALFEYKAFLPDISLDPIPIALSTKATATVNLLELAELQGKGLQVGHVEITPPVGLERPSGAFTLLDSAQGTSSGERLISTVTDLCESWSVRFLNGQPAGSSTDLLFFVPDNPGGVVATGKVFNESGGFVEDIEAKVDQEAFRLSIDEPAGSGSIEWTFAQGLMGSITAVHRLGIGDKVAVPGFCRRSGHPGAQSLILPFFQADLAVNTYVAVHNETDEEVKVEVSYSDKEEEKKTVTLARHAVWTANLRNYLPVEIGFLKIEAFRIQDDTQEKLPVDALSGDFIRVGPDGLAGSALVENPAGLCQTWDVHFDQGTRFLVYIQGEGNLELNARDEDGNPVSVTPPNTGDRSFLVSAADLGLIGKGSVEWKLGAPGYVTTLLSGNGSSAVLIPGACLDKEPPPEN